MKTGYLQTIEIPSENEIIIKDQIYGDHRITEPVLIELLQCPELTRLRGVCQHGITGLLGLSPTETRYEHSVGAFLLVRKVGGSLEEQVAGLLHDISHTTLSHVMDWALSKPGESFHEVHKERYIRTTQLPQILTRHGIDLDVFNEELYPLVERPSPRLCADRLDYALRDTLIFGKLSLVEVRGVFDSLTAFPSENSPDRLLTLSDPKLALSLARAYIAVDREVWCNEAHVDMYRQTGQLIGDMVRRGVIEEEVVWKLSDQDFWQLLRSKADQKGREVMDRLESGVSSDKDLRLPRAAKIRTIDPDIFFTDICPLPLSAVFPEWASERQEYISSRQALLE
ncbi:hypothetical protein EYZ11_003481 [Aspergillus tanneri]|uniref:HD/PDEase domain-containing protein n=1 Tax=Aspergillus tanneri TaxID=1220188 RepID=A0A4S3JQC7_9EURO|nr:uncharacterized protein ATNIH1004_007035 [Aspergillus tanneri]KAA8645616.1 hypothetical protein ATNIH1004_007035 [Aspergillus tanneri]THC97038.1 hypothetical protein EYZ11_003481 [Aspergillus tanneri]